MRSDEEPIRLVMTHGAVFADNERSIIMVSSKKKKLSANSSSSIAYLKFIKRHEAELHSYWFHQAAAIYATRWLDEHTQDIPNRLTSFPGDGVLPFTHLDVTPATFSDLVPTQQGYLAHSALFRLVTLFENFLYDGIQRAIYLEPGLLAKSDLKIEASALAEALLQESARAWFGHYVADKMCRGKSPAELITRVDGLLKAGIATRLRCEVDEWVLWTLVRNSVAHLGGDVTRELADKWPARFPQPGSKISLTTVDVTRVASLSRTLAAALDNGQVPLESRKADSELIASELFVRNGVDDPSDLSYRVSAILSVKITKEDAVRLLAKFRRSEMPDTGVTITDAMLSTKASVTPRKKRS